MKHLVSEPEDANALLKVGDLHLKRGDKAAAIEAYARVATQFSRSGFDAKSVAIYKQILKVDGSNLDARINLGDHFQRMGLVSDALREFQEGVQVCQELGLKREAFDLLKRVSTLDPGNVTNRLSLADLLMREDLRTESLDEYGSLLDEFEGQSDPETVVRICEQMMESFPESQRAVKSYVGAQFELEEPATAIEFLKDRLPLFPDDIPIREMLVSAYQRIGDEEASQLVYREMAELHKRHGDNDRAREILQRFVPLESFGDDEPESSPSLILAEAVDSLEPVAEPEPDLDDLTGGDASSDDLLAEARVSLEFGDLTDAKRRAQAALKLDPGAEDALEFLATVEKELAADTASSERLELDTKPPDDLAAGSAAAQAILEQPTPQPQPLAEPATVLDDGNDTETLPDIELVLEDEVEAEEKPAAAEAEAGAEPESEEIDLEIDIDDLEIAPPPEDIDLDVDELRAEEPEPGATPQPGKPVDLNQGDSSSWAAQSTWVNENLDEAEFYFEQGMHIEAEGIYRRVLEQVPHHAQALLRLGELTAMRGGDPGMVGDSDTPEAFGDTQVRGSAAQDPAPAEVSATPLTEFDGQFGDESIANVEFDIPDPGDVAPAPEIDAQEPPAVAEELEVEIETELEADVVLEADDEEESPFDLAAALDDEAAASPAPEQDSDFQEVFQAFKRGIQEQIGDDESEAHYDLAIAYKEMGLLDDAIEQLALIRAAGDSGVEALSLMAICKREQGKPEEAVAHLTEALSVAGDGDASAVALRYDLGEALLESGKRTEAIEAFQKVAAADPGFRDTAARISELAK